MNSPYLDNLRNKEIAELKEKVASLEQQLADARAYSQVPSGCTLFKPRPGRLVDSPYAGGSRDYETFERIDGPSPMPADEVAALKEQGEQRRIEYFKGVIRAIEGHVAALGSLCLPIVEVKPEFVCRALLQIEEQLTAQKFELAQLKSDLDVARACKPDEYTLLRSCERACQSDLAKAKNVIAAADKLAEACKHHAYLGSTCIPIKPIMEARDAYLALRQPQNGDTDGNPSR